MPNCLNCNDPWVKGEIYCSNCGQRTQLPSLSIWLLIADFFQNLFNLDSKIWMTLKDIWGPAKITKAYLHGKRQSYYNPIRIFLIALFTFFALILSLIGDQVQKANDFIDAQKIKIERKATAQKLDSFLFENNFDSIFVTEAKFAIFSKEKISLIDSAGMIDVQDGLFSFSFGENDENSIERYLAKSSEEIEEEFKDDHKLERLLAVQFHKILLEPSKGIAFLLGNGTWAVVLFILLIALFFKLLYIRNTYLYVEHVLFHLNGHTRILLVGIMLCLVSKFIVYQGWYILVFYLSGMIYLLFSIKKFYNQSWLKTVIKYLISLFFMSIFITLSMTAILYFSLMVF